MSYEIKLVRDLLLEDTTLPDDCKLVLRTTLNTLKWVMGKNKKGL